MLAVLGLFAIALAGIALLPGTAESEVDDSVPEDNQRPPDELDGTIDEANDVVSDNDPAPFEELYLSGDTEENAETKDFLHGGAGNDHLVAGDGDVLFGGGGLDTYELEVGDIAYIQDYQEGELLVISHDGDAPEIGFDQTDDGLSILANGYPIAILNEVYSIDESSIFLSHSLFDD